MGPFGKFSLVVAVAALAASLGSAQTAKTRIQTVIIAPSQVSCPVGIQAQHAPGFTAQVPAGKSGSESDAAHRGTGEPLQHLQLTLNNPKRAAISEVRIRVRGWRAKGRTVPAQTAGADYTDASRMFDLKVDIVAHGTAKKDVWVHGMTAVNSIELIGVSYDDGSSWEPASLQVCSIMPDPAMLISQKSQK
jgi:hypothetical protein